jgi:hypothetical protein
MPTENQIQRYRPDFADGYHADNKAGTLVHYADHLASHAFDEPKERELCRAEWEAGNSASHFEPVPFPDFWSGWKACAIARANTHALVTRGAV